ncbi:MAG: CvpA family protein [Oscillospiraceae bacterium]|jgi:uncharacterized membrane protein required for colicin V production|nr:CvpA family protein [Oscillospiraceae bacterium]MBQ5339442.1 CvpA family protein [Oscillospiraceae bacterium]
MSTSFWWVFDFLVIAIAVYIVIVNAKRGVTKSIVLGIGYVLTTVAASLLAAVAAPALYQSVAYDNNIRGITTANKHMDFAEVFSEAINNQDYGYIMDVNAAERILKNPKKCADFENEFYDYGADKTGGPFATRQEFGAVLRNAFLESYGNELDERVPRYVRMYFDKQVRSDPTLMGKLITVFYDNTLYPDDKADVLEQQFAAKPTTEVLQIFIYLIIFSVVMVIVALISAILQNRIFFNIQNSTDHAVGMLIGVIEAGVMLVLFTLISRLLVLLMGGHFLFFNEETIAETKLFSFFYDHISILL